MGILDLYNTYTLIGINIIVSYVPGLINMLLTSHSGGTLVCSAFDAGCRVFGIPINMTY